MGFVKYVLAVFVLSGAHSAKELPPFLHVCKRDDPQLTTCMMASVEDLRPYLVEGVPEYNIPSLEPLVMTDFFADEAAGMKIVVSNVSAWGCSDFFVRGLDVNVDTLQFTVDVDIPKLRIEAHYHIDGKLLLVPVKGDGNMETNITEVSARAELQGQLNEKDGEQYMTYIDTKLKVHVGGGSVRMANLFNGDKVLLAMINDVVNRNLDVFLKELMPVIEKALASVFQNTGNVIVGSFPFSQLFPQ
ncbi:circadian clock-controlled protein daywake-like [Anthonomus grandis grandis]|uniref:circadian clock-controlled protein daywake-like n=1 Tax=Anthonomus grandis grandis TaxID=2921223 RepID=UPI002165A2F8|nr:circadian clock-controlled protein daywake-like [Anthonomus grandis grandis]